MTLADILEFCLQEIESGRKTLADCAAQFPEFKDLETQLRAAQLIRSFPAPTLRPAISHQIENRLRRHALPPRPQPDVRWKWATGVVVMIACMLAMFWATSVSLPGDALYGLKRMAETAQLGLTPPSAYASQYIVLSERRLVEINTLARTGRLYSAPLADLLTDFNYYTETALATVPLASPSRQASLLSAIVQVTEKGTLTLQTLQANLSPEANHAVHTALDEAELNTTLAVEQLNILSAEPTEAVASPMPSPIWTNTARPTQTFTHTPTPIVLSTATRPDPTSTSLAPDPFTSTVTTPSPSATRTSPGQPPTPTVGEPEATPTRHGPPASTPNCHAQGQHSPNYCTPTPAANTPMGSSPTAVPASATPCPTNASGKPKCHP